jgi:hypothetical protein
LAAVLTTPCASNPFVNRRAICPVYFLVIVAVLSVVLKTTVAPVNCRVQTPPL